MSAFKTQVGGDYYTKLAIQPMEYSMANKLDACQHSIIKYVTRFRDKNGLADLQKARHVIDMLIEREYPNVKEQAPEEPKSECEWIEWHGGKCPVNPETLVQVRLRDGYEELRGFKAYRYSWGHDANDDPNDIIAYRVVK